MSQVVEGAARPVWRSSRGAGWLDQREIGEVGDEAPSKVHRVYSESNVKSLKSQSWKDDMI